MSAAEHSTRLTRAEAEIRALKEGQQIIFGKLDAIASALSDMRATSGPAMRDTLAFVRDGAVLFSLVVGGILYLASATHSRGMSDLETRLTRLETIVGLATRQRVAPSAYVPETLLGVR